jgi:endonuclease/exonuclease/phosphatase family metal-dependent hydrolase
MFPVRFSVVTYNLWGTERWSDRAEPVRTFMKRFRPDVLSVQEITPETTDFLDHSLPDHHRVEDDLAGWSTESNIWWRADLFERVVHGAEEFGCTTYPDRRMFWVRLRPRDRDTTLIVSTAHLTDFGTPHELETGESPRVREAHALVAGLQRIVGDDEAALVMGDFNDSIGALVPLLMAGYMSCFGALEQIPPPTMPTALDRFGGGGFTSSFVLDWILANRRLRAISAASPHLYVADVPPSDHWPVQAVYELTETPTT